jgi:hypothetical protein
MCERTHSAALNFTDVSTNEWVSPSLLQRVLEESALTFDRARRLPDQVCGVRRVRAGAVENCALLSVSPADRRLLAAAMANAACTEPGRVQ